MPNFLTSVIAIFYRVIMHFSRWFNYVELYEILLISDMLWKRIVVSVLLSVIFIYEFYQIYIRYIDRKRAANANKGVENQEQLDDLMQEELPRNGELTAPPGSIQNIARFEIEP